jgi:uncharacterized membrane protein
MAFAVGAIVAQYVTVWLDTLAREGAISLPAVFGERTPAGVIEVTGLIAAASATALALVVTLTVTVLANAGQAFGQRLIRNFVRATITKVTLGLFLASTVFSLGVLYRTTGGPSVPAPSLSTAVSVTLALAAVLTLILYINHVATELQAPSVIAGVARDLWEVIQERRHDAEHGRAPHAASGDDAREAEALLAREGRVILAGRSGYVQSVDVETLFRAADDAGVMLRFRHRPGHFVLYHTTIAQVWPPDRAPEVMPAIERAVRVGRYRTLRQDLKFAVDQMVEVALRALSPAINDTFTALQCVDWLGDALLSIADAPEPPRVHANATGEVRLIAPVLTFHRAVGGAFDKLRQNSVHNVSVSIRILGAIARLAPQLRDPAHRAPLTAQLDMTVEGALAATPVAADREMLIEAYRTACEALGHAPQHG